MRDGATGETKLDSATFRVVMGFFPTGVALITCGSGSDTDVITANAVTSISLEPPLVLVAVTAQGRVRHGIERQGSFAVNFLGEDQDGLANLFSKRNRPRGVAAIEVLGGDVGRTGDALLAKAVAGLECTLVAEYPGGDHIVFLGQVIATHIDDEMERRPLLFHRGRYTTVLPLPRLRDNGKVAASGPGHRSAWRRWMTRMLGE